MFLFVHLIKTVWPLSTKKWNAETLYSIVGENGIKVLLAIGWSERSRAKAAQLQHDLPGETIESSLRTLNELSLVTKRGKKWLLTETGIHAFRQCLLFDINQQKKS
ncbi:MAG: hypothetical protein ACFFCQ_17205 [Promethearchaeota archaeon]